MLQTFKNGQGSVVIRAKLLDSSSTAGAGLTGLTNASSGLIISTIADNEATATVYTVAASNVETITTLGTYAAPTASKCRFKEVDATNHKGVYEFQFADARFAVASAKSLLVSVAGATNLQQADFLVQLQSDDPYVAKPANFNLLSIDGSGLVNLVAASRPGIRKNTALSNFEFLMTDSTNHLPVTGKTVTVTRSIDGAAFAAGTLSAVTEVSNGMYRVDFGAGDLNGDIVTLRATAAGADDLFVTISTDP